MTDWLHVEGFEISDRNGGWETKTQGAAGTFL